MTRRSWLRLMAAGVLVVLILPILKDHGLESCTGVTFML